MERPLNHNGIRASIIIRSADSPGVQFMHGHNAPGGDQEAYLAGALLAIAGIPLPAFDSREWQLLPVDYIWGYRRAQRLIPKVKGYGKTEAEG